MQKIITEADLRMAILELEAKQLEEGKILKDQFLIAYESIKPINLIKNTLMEAAKSSEIQGSILNSSLGIAAGYMTKAVFMGATGGPFRNILGNLLMFGIKSIVTSNSGTVNSVGNSIFNKIRGLWPDKDETDNHKTKTIKT